MTWQSGGEKWLKLTEWVRGKSRPMILPVSRIRSITQSSEGWSVIVLEGGVSYTVVESVDTIWKVL